MKILLTIEKGKGKLWGRITYKDNLIVDYANNVHSLGKKMRKLLFDFNKISNVEFSYAYDLAVFFEEFSYLKQSKIAELAGINPALLRQYASRVRNPSANQAKKIENAVHKLARELQSVLLAVAS